MRNSDGVTYQLRAADVRQAEDPDHHERHEPTDERAHSVTQLVRKEVRCACDEQTARVHRQVDPGDDPVPPAFEVNSANGPIPSCSGRNLPPASPCRACGQQSRRQTDDERELRMRSNPIPAPSPTTPSSPQWVRPDTEQ